MHALIQLASEIQQSDTGSVTAGSVIAYVCVAIGMWPMLAKAGVAPWGGFIPIWNSYVQIKLAGYSGWLMFLYLIPFVNVVVLAVVSVGVARAFGKDGFYGFWLLFVLQPLGYLILGLSGAKYTEIQR